MELLTTLLPYIIGGAGIVGLYVSWNSRKAQVQITESNALQEMQKAYETFVTNNREQYADLMKDNAELKAKLEMLEAKHKVLQEEFDKQKNKCRLCSNNSDK